MLYSQGSTIDLWVSRINVSTDIVHVEDITTCDNGDILPVSRSTLPAKMTYVPPTLLEAQYVE